MSAPNPLDRRVTVPDPDDNVRDDLMVDVRPSDVLAELDDDARAEMAADVYDVLKARLGSDAAADAAALVVDAICGGRDAT